MGIIMALWCAGHASADEPLDRAERYLIKGANGDCWATTERATRSTAAYRRLPSGKTEQLWAIRGFFRVTGLSSDCTCFVAGRDGGNLLPITYAQDVVLLSFYRHGQLQRELRLNDLVRDPERLQRTASHWDWGAYIGAERDFYYRVSTVERGAFVFDMRTGRTVIEP